MEELKKEVKDYLSCEVNPVIKPLIDELIRKKPSNVVAFIHEYTFKLMGSIEYIQLKKKIRKYSQIQTKIVKK
jgi:hypothetical protein